MGELIIPRRRGFLLGLGSLFAAPAIVRVAAHLMPVSSAAVGHPNLLLFGEGYERAHLWPSLADFARRAHVPESIIAFYAEATEEELALELDA